MPAKWIPPDRDELIRLYLSGESQKALAARYGLPSRLPINRVLKEAGVPIRGRHEAALLRQSRAAPEERKRNAEAAHAAVRGRKAPLAEKIKRAQTNERNQTHATETERHLAGLLTDRGLACTLQKAVGPYNLDIAVGPVAVEVFGGNWHGHGRHLARAPKRFRYILDQGWPFVVVWTDARHAPLLPDAADYIAAFAELTSRDETARREYRVIWGTGEEASPVKPQFDKIALIPSRTGRGS